MVEYPTANHDRFAPLEDRRVVDLGRVVSAPVATAALGALGADVVRVEAPGGDLSWKLPPFVRDDGGVDDERGETGIPLGHLRRSRGKQSVVMDLRTAAGRRSFTGLLAETDVVVENYRPGTLQRLGIDIGDLLEQHPKLIWCSISGYGSTGPWADRAAIDITVQAESGLLHRTGTPGGERVRAGATVVDHLAANWAVTAVLSALMERDRTGLGRHLDVSMLEAIGSVMWDDALDAGIGVEDRTGNDDPRGCPHGVYQCGDGAVAVVVTSDKQWRALVDEHLDAPALRELTGRERVAERDRVEAALLTWLRGVNAESAAEALADLSIAVGVVRPPETTASHPQHRHRGFLAPLLSSGGSSSPFLGAALPFQVDGRNPRPGPAVETLGASGGGEQGIGSGPVSEPDAPTDPTDDASEAETTTRTTFEPNLTDRGTP